MDAPKSVAITGGSATNPRCARHIVERLNQIERDTLAMWEEAVRLRFFSDLRQVMTDQGMSARVAQDATENVGSRIKALQEALAEASKAAELSSTAIYDSKVNLNARFEWRPTWQR